MTRGIEHAVLTAPEDGEKDRFVLDARRGPPGAKRQESLPNEAFDETPANLRIARQRVICVSATLPQRWPTRMRQRALDCLPMIGLIAWFVLPIGLAAGVCEALVIVEIQLSRGWPGPI